MLLNQLKSINIINKFNKHNKYIINRYKHNDTTIKIHKSFLNLLNPTNDSINVNWQTIQSSVKQQNQSLSNRIIVLDDDPTGNQTVYNINLLFDYSIDTLVKQLQLDHKVFFILTNTRSMNESDCTTVINQVMFNISEAIRITKYTHRIQFISRGDSTLRGHYPLETNLISKFLTDKKNSLGYYIDATILIPAFFEGGRITFDNIHFVIEDEHLIPSGQTSFAKDEHFGYSNSNLVDWVIEKHNKLIDKSNRRITRENIVCITLTDIREGGPYVIADKLLNIKNSSIVIVNAVNQDDLNIFTLGAIMAENDEMCFIYRTSASFVSTKAGLPPRPLINSIITNNSSKLVNNVKLGGLIVVGSYVSKSTNQLTYLLDKLDIHSIELDVEYILSVTRDSKIGSNLNVKLSAYIKSIANVIDELLLKGVDICIYTSRKYTTGTSIDDLNAVNYSLTEIVKQLTIHPSFVLAKGGITSHSVASHSYNCKQAVVVGQIEKGIPIWLLHTSAEELESKTNNKGIKIDPLTNQLSITLSDIQIPYIVFPGNVGHIETLANVARKLGVKDKLILNNSNSASDNHADVVKKDIKYLSNGLFVQRPKYLSNKQNELPNYISTLQFAQSNKRAVAAFNIYNLEGVKAVAKAAEITQQPVILQVHPGSLKFGNMQYLDLLSSYRYYGIPAKDISIYSTGYIPIYIQIDHIEDDDDIKRTIEWGLADGIMIDGSSKPIDLNIEWTKHWTTLAHNEGLVVEGELGRISGNEDDMSVLALEAKMTDPIEAKRFISETNIDILAVTIGNVHGIPTNQPYIDITRLINIKTTLDRSLPLVLHGASGLPDDIIITVINNGVCKMNINTDIRYASVNAIKKEIRINNKVDLLDIMKASTEAMTNEAIKKIILLTNRSE